MLNAEQLARDAPSGVGTSPESPAAAREREPSPWVTATLLLAIFFALVGFRLFLARGMEVPTLYSDEMGYFAHARYLAGRGAPQFVPRTPDVSLGYSLLLTPLYWLFDESLDVFRWALHLNAVIASCHLFLLFLVARSLFALPRFWAIGAAASASLYPPLLVHSNFAWSDNVLPLLFTTWLLSATACWRRRTLASALALAVVCGALYLTHRRMLPLILVAVGFLVLLGWRRRLSLPSVLAALVVIGALLVAAYAANEALHERMWSSEGRFTVERFAKKLVQTRVWPRFLLVAVGQSWYLLASTLGLAALGLARFAQQARRPSPAEKSDGRQCAAQLALCGVLSAFCLSVAYLADGRRIDHLVYGRYNELFVPILVVASLTWVHRLDDGWNSRLLCWGASVLALGPIVTFVRLSGAHDRALMPLTVMGVVPFQTTPPTTTLDFPAITLASAGCALALGILLRWRVGVGLVALAAACLWGAVRIERQVVAPLAVIFPRVYTLHHLIDTLPPE